MSETSDTTAPPSRLSGTAAFLWALSAGGLTAAVVGWTPLRGWALWWHLAMGRLIDSFSAVPVANHTLYTLPELTPSWVQPWLGQRLLYLAHEYAGLEGVLTARALLYGLALALVVGITSRGVAQTWQRRALGVGSGLAVGWWGMRAGTSMYVAPVFAALMGLAMQRASSLTPGRRLIRDVLCFGGGAAWWASVDPACWWPALIAICGLVGAARAGTEHAPSWRHWLAVLLASLAALIVNPRGAALYSHLVELWTTYPGNPHIPGWAHVLPGGSSHGVMVLVGVSFGVWSLWRVRGASKARHALLALSGLVACWYEGGALWLGLALPALGVGEATADEVAPADSDARLWALATLCVMLGLLSQPLWLFHGNVAQRIPGTRQQQPHLGVIAEDVPLEAIELARRHYAATPHIFHPPALGGYVLWRLMDPRQDRQVAYNDERVELVPDAIWRAQAAALRDAEGWRELEQRYRIDAALLEREPHHMLIAHLKRAGWYVAHEDARYVLLIRRT